MEIAELEIRIREAGVKAAEDNLRFLERMVGRTEGGFTRLQARVVSLDATLNLLTRGMRATTSIVGAAMREAAGQERALAGLNAQLQAQGRYSEEYSRRLQQQAAALQQVTTWTSARTSNCWSATRGISATLCVARSSVAASWRARCKGGDDGQPHRRPGMAACDLSRSGLRLRVVAGAHRADPRPVPSLPGVVDPARAGGAGGRP